MFLFRLLLLALLFMTGAGCSSVRTTSSANHYRENSGSTPSKSSNASSKESAWRNSLISAADKYIGTPYRYGSTEPEKGLDCSGLVFTVARQNRLDVPRSSSLMAKNVPHMDWNKSTTGDLLFFGIHGKIDHVGWVEKNTGHELYVIHSTTHGGVLRENVLSSSYWKKRILFAVDITVYRKSKT